MKILLVDDEPVLRKGVSTFLSNIGYDVNSVSNGTMAMEVIDKENFDVIISDVQMPGLNGIEFLKKLRNGGNLTPFIIITAFANVQDAVLCMKLGADDYLTKPINLEELKIKIEKISLRKKLEKENTELREELNKIKLPEIVGESKLIIEMKKLMKKISSDPDVTVMIYGESGTGKELVAQNIHLYSERNKNGFVAINCAAIPDDLLESELFGYVKGAFTGANKDKTGFFELADKGTIFLDEVGEMSPAMQAKLLRVLQNHEIQRLGSTKTIKVDVRVIGASNKKLDELVKEGKFREDLYYRLNITEIQVPPLRKRNGDLPLLIEFFIRKTKSDIKFSKQALELLKKYSWPGNVRELENLIRMLAVTLEERIVGISNLPDKILNETEYSTDNWNEYYSLNDFQTALHKAVTEFEKKYLLFHLNKNGNNISKTAKAINLSRVSLYKKIKEYRLEM